MLKTITSAMAALMLASGLAHAADTKQLRADLDNAVIDMAYAAIVHGTPSEDQRLAGLNGYKQFRASIGHGTASATGSLNKSTSTMSCFGTPVTKQGRTFRMEYTCTNAAGSKFQNFSVVATAVEWDNQNYEEGLFFDKREPAVGEGLSFTQWVEFPNKGGVQFFFTITKDAEA